MFTLLLDQRENVRPKFRFKLFNMHQNPVKTDCCLNPATAENLQNLVYVMPLFQTSELL